MHSPHSGRAAAVESTQSQAAIGLAISRLDGFVSVDGTKALAGDPPIGRPHFAQYSELVTRSFSFTGSQLHLNVESAPQHGGAGPCEVRVEILELLSRLHSRI